MKNRTGTAFGRFAVALLAFCSCATGLGGEPLNSGSGPANSAVTPIPAGPEVLSADRLVEDVLARNPTLTAAVEAWHAAAARYPQVISLDDPMLSAMKGLREGWMVQASQRLPWPGKRQARGQTAQAEAEAASSDAQDARLRLAEAATVALADYYQADRQLWVTDETARLLATLRETAKVRYEAGGATQQDLIQTDLELADLQSRRLAVLRERQTAQARINTLLHLPADSPLPPPPATLSVAGPLPPAAALHELAVRQRADLAAMAARIRAEQGSVLLAEKEYYPDVALVARYDGFMPEEMRPQLGVDLAVPLYRNKRNAQLSEATARLQQRCAEYQRGLDEARFEVQTGWEGAVQSQQTVQLYDQRILGLARVNIESARANYVAGKLDFLRVIEAQRQYRMQQDRYFEATAECYRRLAQLQRAVGGRWGEGGG